MIGSINKNIVHSIRNKHNPSPQFTAGIPVQPLSTPTRFAQTPISYVWSAAQPPITDLHVLGRDGSAVLLHRRPELVRHVVLDRRRGQARVGLDLRQDVGAVLRRVARLWTRRVIISQPNGRVRSLETWLEHQLENAQEAISLVWLNQLSESGRRKVHIFS